jgi:hypothetical protein
MKGWLVVVWVALACGCQNSFDPQSYVTGLRLVAVKAEPPEAAPGDSVAFTTIAVDTAGGPIAIDWAACTRPPPPGQAAVNPDCLTSDTAAFLLPMGSGTALTAAVPAYTRDQLAAADATGGQYLPVRQRVRGASDHLDGLYLLRAPGTGPRNRNPQIVGVNANAVATSEQQPIAVPLGGQVTLRALLSPDSAESYAVALLGFTRTTTEVPRVSWYATAGSFSEDRTGLDKPDTVWRADTHVPAGGGMVDLWVVVREERGGTDFVHRTINVH